MTVTIPARVTPECCHEECYCGTCHGPTEVVVTAEVDLATEHISDVHARLGSREVTLSGLEEAQLSESLFDEADRLSSLCPVCEGGDKANDVCGECRDADAEVTP